MFEIVYSSPTFYETIARTSTRAAAESLLTTAISYIAENDYPGKVYIQELQADFCNTDEEMMISDIEWTLDNC